MNGELINLIQRKIKNLKEQISAIQYTINIDNISSDNDISKINECTHKIQVLNEVIISFGVQNK